MFVCRACAVAFRDDLMYSARAAIHAYTTPTMWTIRGVEVALVGLWQPRVACVSCAECGVRKVELKTVSESNAGGVFGCAL